MSTIAQTAQALEEWVAETCPGISTTYDHEPKAKTSFPEVSAVIKTVTHADAPQQPANQLQQIEQARAKVYEADLVIIVDPEPPDGADDALKGFADALADAAEADGTLGERVFGIGPRFSFDFHPDTPLLEFDDGSRGRRMTASFTVAELMQT